MNRGEGAALEPMAQARDLYFTLLPLMLILPLAAIGYSLVYMLFGGGLFGAVVIFFIAKMLGR